MNRAEKAGRVAELRELFDGVQLVVLTQYAGTDVEGMVKLRRDLREQNAGYRVTKNTLAKLAAADTDLAGLDAHFQGPIGIAYTHDDAAAAAKVLVDFAKEQDSFEVMAGFLDGGRVLDAGAIEQLSKLPSKDELRATLLSTMAGVPRKMVSLLAAVPRGMVGVLDARRRQLEEGAG